MWNNYLTRKTVKKISKYFWNEIILKQAEVSARDKNYIAKKYELFIEYYELIVNLIINILMTKNL